MKVKCKVKQQVPLAPIMIIGTHGIKINFTTVGDVAIAGIHPPLVMISLHEGHFSTLQIKQTQQFSLNVPNVSQLDLIHYCSQNTGHDLDKSKAIPYEIIDGLPTIKACPTVMTCQVLESITIEKRCIFVAKILDAYESHGIKTPVLYSLDDQFHTIKTADET